MTDRIKAIGRHAPVSCPDCGILLDGWGSLEPDAASGPSPGDLTVCSHCFAVLEFQAGGDLLLLSSRDISQLPEEVRAMLERAEALVRGMAARRKQS